jgi:hypothetical protein
LGGWGNGPNAVPELRLSGQHESRELSKVRRADPAPRPIKATACSNDCACLRLTKPARHRHSLTGDRLPLPGADVRARIIQR